MRKIYATLKESYAAAGRLCVYVFFAAALLLNGMSVMAQDTWVFTFNYATTSKKNLTWNSQVTKNGVAQNDVLWNHSANAVSYTQGSGCYVSTTPITICSSISINYIKSVSVYYTSEYSGHTVKMSYFDPLTTDGFTTYNTANEYYSNTSVGTAYSEKALTKNFAESEAIDGYVQLQFKAKATNKKIAITKVVITTYEAPKRTVSFDCHGVAVDPAPLTEAVSGEGVRLPSASLPSCARWQFVGWLYEPQLETVTAAPPLLKHPGSIFKPNEDVTLHGVYRKYGAYVETSTQYLFSKTDYTLETEKGTWSGPTPDYVSEGTGVGYSFNATISSPRTYTDITKIHVKGNLARFWASGTIIVYIDGVEVMRYDIRPDEVLLDFDAIPASATDGEVEVEFKDFNGEAVAIDYIEIYYSDYVGYYYTSVPDCPEDITPKILWGVSQFTIEGAQSGRTTYPYSVDGVYDAVRDVLTFSGELTQGDVFELIVDGGNKAMTVPAIVSEATASVSTTEDEDIVILPGAKLTLWSGTVNARNLYIYRQNDASGQLDMRGGTLNLSGESRMVLTINPDRYYFFGTPYESQLANAYYLNGAEANYNTSSASLDWWIVQNYDGARRAQVGYDWNNWQGIQSSDATLNAGEGHAIGIDIVGKAHAQRSYVFPLQCDLATENDAKQIDVLAHVPASGSAFDEGWNYLSNPYLHNMKGAGASMPGSRMLYFVLPYDGTDQRFQQYLASEVQSIAPFSTFFVQVRGSENTTLTLGSNGARAAAPRHNAASAHRSDVVAAEPLLLRLNVTAPDNDRDHATLVVDNDFRADQLVIGEDQEKLGDGDFIQLYALEQDRRLAFDAISRDDAQAGTRLGLYLPAAGQYTLSFSVLNANTGDLEAVYLVDDADNTVTDLLASDATFSAASGLSNDRFSLRVAFKGASDAHEGDESLRDMEVIARDGEIAVSGIAEAKTVRLFNAEGKLVLQTNAQGSWRSQRLPQGAYVLLVGNTTRKVVL